MYRLLKMNVVRDVACISIIGMSVFLFGLISQPFVFADPFGSSQDMIGEDIDLSAHDAPQVAVPAIETAPAASFSVSAQQEARRQG